MRKGGAEPPFCLEVVRGLRVVISPPGASSLESQVRWKVTEVGRQVSIASTAHPDTPSDVDRQIASFSLQEEAADPTAAVQKLAVQSLNWILRDEARVVDSGDFVEGRVRLESTLLSETMSTEHLVAVFCDAIRDWYSFLAGDDMWDELGLSGHPLMDLDIEIVLPAPVADRVRTEGKLGAVARRFEATIADAVESTDVVEDLCRGLPSIIAVSYGQIDARRSLHAKFIATVTTFEAAIRYLASVALAPVQGQSRQERLQHLFSGARRPPTLGWYVRTVQEKAQELRELFPVTMDAMLSKAGKPTNLGRFVVSRLTAIRNDYMGHGAMRAESEYVEPLQEVGMHLRVLLEGLADDGRSTMIAVRSGLEFGTGDTFDYELTLLSGTGVTSPRKRIVASQRLDGGRVYVWQTGTGTFVDADPLIIYADCPRCGFEETFFLDRFEPTRPGWLSYRSGHRFP